MLTLKQKESLVEIDSFAKRSSISLYVVGGFVRDLIRGGLVYDRDIDILVDGNGLEFSQALHRECGGELKLFSDFFTAKIIKPTRYQGFDEIDFASARAETYTAPGVLPKVSLAPLNQDLKRRDFSINAIALPLAALIEFNQASPESIKQLESKCIDPFDGRGDLYARIIRILHERSFVDDPTRLFRAIRYLTRIEGSFDVQTEQLFTQAIANGACATVSWKRIVNELLKMLSEPKVSVVIEESKKRGLIKALQPNMITNFDNQRFSDDLSKIAQQLEQEPDRAQIDNSYLLLLIMARSLTTESRKQLFDQLSTARKIRAQCLGDIENIDLNNSIALSHEAQLLIR